MPITTNTSPLAERMKDSGRHFTAGGIAGMIEVCFAHPFDCMKTRLQIGQFYGVGDCARRTLRNEGPSGFYKGLLPPLIIETPKRAIKFMAFDWYWRFLRSDTLPTWMRYSIGQSPTAIRAEHAACPATVAREIARSNGWGTEGLYRGIGANLWRHGVWNSCYFGIYHNLRILFCPPKQHEQDDRLGLATRLLIASLSAIIANLANIPFDVAKSRIQGPQPATGRLYFRTWQSIRLVQRQHGFRSVYRSLLPFAFIFGPGGGMMLVVYEGIYKWLTRHAVPSGEL
uniref:Mitochondrial 2-oxodicarboxylate carrier n=1 Tax=Globodera rostochiensis TaxID=31243 RepID=A0A914HDS3_GLORO